MKRICGHCNMNMGEKCGKCGSTRLKLYPLNAYYCFDCLHIGRSDREPVTTGICDACALALRQAGRGVVQL